LLAEASAGAGLQPLTLTNERAIKAAEALLPSGPTYVGFAPGAGGAGKRWPLERYIALAKAQEARGRTPVFFFGPDEDEDAARAATAVPDALFPEDERTDAYTDIKGPLLVIALAGRLAAAVANDAGPGHMLAAGGAPLLSLQKDRRKAVKFRPAARKLELLVAEDYGSGMDALPLDPVTEALERLLA
jgi:ADP-heptose:LPS heptosyltransferase